MDYVTPCFGTRRFRYPLFSIWTEYLCRDIFVTDVLSRKHWPSVCSKHCGPRGHEWVFIFTKKMRFMVIHRVCLTEMGASHTEE